MIHIVFDLDGTLADTQKIHQKIESDFLATKGIYIDPLVIGSTYAGRSPVEWIPECFLENNKNISEHEIATFVEGKDRKVIDLLGTGEVQLIPGVLNTLNRLRKMGVKMAISSGACREFIDKFLLYFSLNMIDASTSADEVVNKKPAPDVFLASFQKLEKIYGVTNIKWVVGDGKSDIVGGKSAGAKTILCYNNYDISYSFRVDTFEDIIRIITN